MILTFDIDCEVDYGCEKAEPSNGYPGNVWINSIKIYGTRLSQESITLFVEDQASKGIDVYECIREQAQEENESIMLERRLGEARNNWFDNPKFKGV